MMAWRLRLEDKPDAIHLSCQARRCQLVAPVARDCCYVLGYHGFVYAGHNVISRSTVRHSGVLLVSTDYTPIQLSVRGRPAVRAQAMVVPPLVARSIDAQGVPLLSFNVMPSHDAFHVFSAMQHPGVVLLDRHAFNQFDDQFLALHRGDMCFAKAETFFEEVVSEAVRQLDRPRRRLTRRRWS